MWVGVGAMFIGSLVVAEVGRRAANGTLPRNHVAGIRVRATMRDDETWRTAHLAAGPVMVVTGLVSAAVAIGAGVISGTHGDDAAAAVVLGAAGVLLVGVLWSARCGLRAIR